MTGATMHSIQVPDGHVAFIYRVPQAPEPTDDVADWLDAVAAREVIARIDEGEDG